MKKIFLPLILIFSDSAFAISKLEYQATVKEYKSTSVELSETYKIVSKTLLRLRNTRVTEDFRDRISDIEKSLKGDTRKTIKFVKAFLDSRRNKVLLDDDLLMRLALLHYKNSNYSLQEDMDTYHNKLSAYYSGRTSNSPAIPTPDFSETQKYCDRLLSNYPNSEFSDYATYLKAVIDEENGEYERALKFYKEIVDNFPYSKHRTEAIWRYAELSFDFQNYSAASESYNEIVKLNNNTYMAKAHYKLGSIQYTQKKYKDAKKSFNLLLKDLEKSDNSSLNRNLRKEVYEYLGLLHLQGISLENMPEGVELQALQAVAKRLERHNQYSFARNIYKNYITKNYYNSQVPAYYNLLIESLEGDSKINESISYREKLLKHIYPDGKWWKKNPTGDARFVSQEVSEKTKLFLARYYAQKAFEDGKRKLFVKSRAAYKKFVKEELYSSELAQAYFELGQVEDELTNYSMAKKYYAKSLELGLQGEDRIVAAYNQFFATKNELRYIVPKFGTNVLRNPVSKLSKTELTMLDTYQKLSSNWKNTSDELPVKYFITQIYLSRANFKEAIGLLDSILAQDNIGSDQISYVEDSAKWLIEIHSKNKDWEKVSKVNDRMKTMGAVSQLKPSKLAKMRFNNSVLSEAEVKESQGDLSGAALSFLNFAVNNPKNYESDRAKFKAAQLFRSSSNYKKSNEILAKIFNTEYRKDVLRMYTQNLLDSFRFNEASSFVSKLKKSDHKSDPSLKNVIKLKRFLSPEASISEKFWTQYLKTKNSSFGIQAVKEDIYSNELSDLARKKKRLYPKIKDKLTLKALEIQEEWFVGDKTKALEKCESYKEFYVKRKKVNSEHQNAYYQCQIYGEYNIQEKISSKLVDEIKKDKAIEASILAEMYLVGRDNTALNALRERSVKEGLAISNLIVERQKNLGFHSFKKYELFPFQIARGEAIPWRKLVRKDREFDLEKHCNKTGYGKCLSQLEKMNKKKEAKDYDLLVKLNLILDNDTSARSIASEWLDSSDEIEKLSLEPKLRRMNLLSSSPKTNEYLNEIFVGDSTENDYFQLAARYYSSNDLRKATFVLNTAQKRFPSSVLVQNSTEYLTGSSEELEKKIVMDPRIWYVNKLSNSNLEQVYISRKKLHRKSEWAKSLKLSKALNSNSKLPKFKNSKSAYYQLLGSYLEYKKGNVEMLEQKMQMAKELGTEPVFDPSSAPQRGVASEKK